MIRTLSCVEAVDGWAPTSSLKLLAMVFDLLMMMMLILLLTESLDAVPLDGLNFQDVRWRCI